MQGIRVRGAKKLLTLERDRPGMVGDIISERRAAPPGIGRPTPSLAPGFMVWTCSGAAVENTATISRTKF